MTLLELPNWPPMLVEIHEAISDALRSGCWSQYSSSQTDRLSALIRQHCDAEHVMLVSSGTLAVELALRACQVRADSEVILAAYDYPGNVRSIDAAGGKPILVDVLTDRWTLDPESVRRAITEKTAAILVSHLYQDFAPIAELRKIADESGIYLIEDACQAPMAVVEGRPAGSWGHLATLSFGGSKVITAGSGGAVLVNEPRAAQRLRILLERPSPVYPLSGLQATALLPQWSALERWNQHRRASAWAFQRCIEKYPDNKTVGIDPAGNLPSLYKWSWLARTKRDRDLQIQTAHRLGLPCGEGFSVFKARARKGVRARDRAVTSHEMDRPQFPNAEDVAQRTIVLDHRALATSPNNLDSIVCRLEEVWKTHDSPTQ